MNEEHKMEYGRYAPVAEYKGVAIIECSYPTPVKWAMVPTVWNGTTYYTDGNVYIFGRTASLPNKMSVYTFPSERDAKAFLDDESVDIGSLRLMSYLDVVGFLGMPPNQTPCTVWDGVAGIFTRVEPVEDGQHRYSAE